MLSFYGLLKIISVIPMSDLNRKGLFSNFAFTFKGAQIKYHKVWDLNIM